VWPEGPAPAIETDTNGLSPGPVWPGEGHGEEIMQYPSHYLYRFADWIEAHEDPYHEKAEAAVARVRALLGALPHVDTIASQARRIAVLKDQNAILADGLRCAISDLEQAGIEVQPGVRRALLIGDEARLREAFAAVSRRLQDLARITLPHTIRDPYRGITRAEAARRDNWLGHRAERHDNA
jgi:hypothetical protein